MKNVLVIDDSFYMRSFISMTLTEVGYRVVGQAANGEQAKELFFKFQPDLITLDYILPDVFGTELLEFFHQNCVVHKVIIVSSMNQNQLADKAEKIGAGGYIAKPFDSSELVAVIDSVAEDDIYSYWVTKR